MNCPKPFLRDLIHLFTSKSRRFAFTFWPIQELFFLFHDSFFGSFYIFFIRNDLVRPACRILGPWTPCNSGPGFFLHTTTHTIVSVLFDHLFFVHFTTRFGGYPDPVRGRGRGLRSVVIPQEVKKKPVRGRRKCVSRRRYGCRRSPAGVKGFYIHGDPMRKGGREAYG